MSSSLCFVAQRQQLAPSPNSADTDDNVAVLVMLLSAREEICLFTCGKTDKEADKKSIA